MYIRPQQVLAVGVSVKYNIIRKGGSNDFRYLRSNNTRKRIN